jgi:tocopherol O-methyltransferase
MTEPMSPVPNEENAPAIGGDQAAAAEGARQYYDSFQWLYNLWGVLFSRNVGGIHYGLWFSDTASLGEAVMNSTKVAASQMGLSRSDKVLDAGCGVGASSVFFAEEFGSMVRGITVSDVQLRQARRLAASRGVQGSCTFSKTDYTRTGFGSGTFTKVVGIESVCYAARKKDFIREAHRLLVGNGRLVVLDGFIRRQPGAGAERDMLERWLSGWRVPSLASLGDFRDSLEDEGFVGTRYTDFGRNVVPSSAHYYRVSRQAYPYVSFLRKGRLVSEGLVKHYESTMVQRYLSSGDDPVITYGMFVADKP